MPSFRIIRVVALIVYGLAFLWSFQANGLPVARLAVLAWVGGAFIVGNIGKPFARQRQMVVDLVFYATMWLAYDYKIGRAHV